MEDTVENKITVEEALKILGDLNMTEFVDPSWHVESKPTEGHFLWLAVDSNGNERMTTCEDGFQRFSPKLYHSKYSMDPKIRKASFEEQKKICSYNDTQMKDDHWIEKPNKNDMGKFGAYPQWCYLPKGTIKKLIGRELTWEDEPVKYEG
jgi:hypothetical protein